MKLRSMCHPCMWCTLMNGIQQPVRSVPSVFPARKHNWSSYSKQSSKGSSPENFVAIGGCFKYAIATRITLQHYRPVEEERKKEDKEQFWLSTVSGLPFKNSYYTLLSLLQTGACKLYVLDVSICFLAMISLCKRWYIDWSRHLVLGPSLWSTRIY